MNKNLKKIFVILIIVLISMISFLGIYVKGDFKYSNKIQGYQYTKSLDKTIVANLKIDESTKEVNYDENGNIVVSTEEKTENSNYTTKEEPVNSEEIKTVENYILCKEIIEKRLQEVGLPEYYVRVDKETGNIQIEFEQDVNVEAGIYYASYIGNAEFLDKDQQVKLDNNDIKKVEVAYNQNKSGAYQVYLNIELNKSGQEKIENLKNEFSNKNEESNNTVEQTNELEENNVEEITNDEEENLTFKFEDEEIGTLKLSDITNNKNLKVNIDTASSNTKTVNNNLNKGAVISILINSGKMPIKYKIDNSQEIISEVSKNQKSIIIYVLIGIMVLVGIYEIIRYKKDGMVVVLSNISAVALLLLLLRYTNVLVGFETFLSILILESVLIYISNLILKNIKDVKTEEELKSKLNKIYKDVMDLMLVILLVAVVFTFISWTEISSIGMTMFWGVISIVLTHFIFERTLLITNRKK